MRFWPKLWALFQSVQGPLELNSCVKLAVGSPECDSLLSRSTPSLARASLISFISSQRSWVSKSVSREEKIPNIMMMMISWSRAHKPAKDCPLFFKHSLNLISAVPWDFSSKSVQWKYTSSRISRFNWDVSKHNPYLYYPPRLLPILGYSDIPLVGGSRLSLLTIIILSHFYWRTQFPVTNPIKHGRNYFVRRLHYAAGEIRSYTLYFPMHRRLWAHALRGV